jgi:hypothetical protein
MVQSAHAVLCTAVQNDIPWLCFQLKTDEHFTYLNFMFYSMYLFIYLRLYNFKHSRT